MSNIALITGGSRGIGKAIALGLAKDGFDIWLNYNSSHDDAISIKKEIEYIGRKCSLFCFDVSDSFACKKTLEPFLKNQTPYILINNAGFTRDNIFGLMSSDEWNNVINVNLNGFYNVTRLIVPYMIHKKKGRIISITSAAGQAGNPGQVNYSAAKAGLIGATKALARELGKRNILVNAVAPGLIKTDMTSKLSGQEYLKAIPLNRIGTPEEVAGCVRFLCSGWASYVTGQILAVNGGLYI